MNRLFRNNDNERGDEQPRFIFASLRRPSRAILSYADYRRFTNTTIFVWFLLVVVVWVFHIEVTISENTMTSMASSSVELAGLSLAVLGILHEFNNKDRWFKIGLLLVAALFIGVVLSGFFFLLIWKPEFSLPQNVTVITVGILGIVFLLNLEWEINFQFLKLRWLPKFKIPAKISASIKRTKAYIPFILPIALVWSPDLNRLTGTIFLFFGANLGLVILMGITTVAILSRKEEKVEDPFLDALRARYEDETQALIRLGEIKIRILDVMQSLQVKEQKVASSDQRPREPRMIDREDLFSRLRGIGITDNQDFINEALMALVEEGKLCRESYSGPCWVVPNEQEIDSKLPLMSQLALIVSQKEIRSKASRFLVEDYRFEQLRNWLAIKSQLPSYVVGEYIVPKVLERLTSENTFIIVEGYNRTVFVNSNWKPQTRWNFILEKAKKIANEYSRYDEEYRQKQVRKALFESLPHTDDADYSYNGTFFNIDDDEFERIVQILRIPTDDLR